MLASSRGRSLRLLLPAALLSCAAACNLIFHITPGEPTGSTGGGGTGGATSQTTSSTDATSTSSTTSTGSTAPVCDGVGSDPGMVAWSQRAGGYYGESGDAMALVSDGVVIAGRYQEDTTLFVGGNLPYPQPSGDPEEDDLFLVKYDPQGHAKWQVPINGPRNQRTSGVVADKQDHLVLAGYFEGSMTFGADALYPLASDVSASPDAWDGFVARFDSTGKPLWSRRFGGPLDEEILAVAVDSTGDVIVAGVAWGDSSGGTIDIGCGVKPLAANETMMFVTKISADGQTVRWCNPYGIDTGYRNYWNHINGLGLAVDAHDNILLAGGAYTDTGTFGNGQLNSYGYHDLFINVIQPDGSYGWAGVWGNADNQWVTQIALDACGNVYLAGGFDGSVTLGSLPVQKAYDDPDAGSGGGSHLFVAKLAPGADPMSYDPVWVRGFWDSGGVGEQFPLSLAVDPQGNVLVAGALWDDVGSQGVDFGKHDVTPPPGPDTNGTHWSDAFVTKLDAAHGDERWTKRYGGTQPDAAGGVAVDATGRVYLTGAFSTQLDFGKGPLVPNGQDVFLLGYGP